MGEGDAAPVRRLPQLAGGHRPLRECEQRLLRDAADSGPDREGDLMTDHRRDGEQPRRLRA